MELVGDYNLVKKDLCNSIANIVKHYFAQLEKDIKNKQLNKNGLTGYLIAISEFYHILPQKDKWLEYSYIIMQEIRTMIYEGSIKNIGLFGGLTDISFAVKIANKKMNCYKSFSKSVESLLIKAVETNLTYLKNNIDDVKVTDYDLINGISGAGMYFLFSESKQETKNIQECIIDYFIQLTNNFIYSDYNIPRWFIKFNNQLRNQDNIDFPMGSIDFGMAHGILAPLLYLSKAYNLGTIIDGQLETINKIIDIYFKFAKVDKNNIYQWPSQLGLKEFVNGSNVYDKRKYRESWCYGSISISRALYLVGKDINNAYLQEFSLNNIFNIANLDNQEYLLESPIICHGYSGLLEILVQTYIDTQNDTLIYKIINLAEIIVDFFNPKFKYGYKDRGTIFQNGDSITKEIEFYDILNGSSGIILSLYSIIKKDTLWQNQLCIN